MTEIKNRIEALYDALYDGEIEMTRNEQDCLRYLRNRMEDSGMLEYHEVAHLKNRFGGIRL